MTELEIFERRAAKRLMRNQRQGRGVIDEVKRHYIDNAPLSPEGLKWMQILEEVKARKVRGGLDSEIRKAVADQFDLTAGEVHKAMLQAMELFGELMEVKKAGFRAVLTERYEILAQKALERFEITSESEWLKIYRDALDSIAKLHMLNKGEDESPRIRRRVVIEYSNNPEVLKADEVSYEDIDTDQDAEE
jgi:hypothetical protein